MRSRYLLAILMGAFLLTGTWMILSAFVAPTTVAQEVVPEDELAFIDNIGRIRVTDPFPQSGVPFSWTSTSTGWNNFAILDSNNDGIDEIVAIGGGIVQLMNPYVPPGTVPPQFAQSIGDGTYFTVVTGDLIPGDGGRDEILVQRTEVSLASSIQIYNGDDSGTSWVLTFNESYGTEWSAIEAGDVDGLEGDEIVMLREKLMKIFKYSPSGLWPTLFENTFSNPWLALDIGNSHTNNGNVEEIITTRTGVGGTLASFLVFQYHNNSLSDAPNGESKYFPYFSDIASGDVNLSGDEEVFMVRDPEDPGRVSLLGRNWQDDPFPSEWEDGIPLGRSLKRVVMGDLDGDLKDEVVVATSDSYRIYIEPGSNLNNNGVVPTAFKSPVAIGTGDFDGEGAVIEPPKLQVLPNSLEFEMVRDTNNPAEQTFTVNNIGGGGGLLYDVALENNQPWISVIPFEGVTPGTHAVSVNGQGLNPGTYTDRIIVTARNNEVLDSPQYINVTFTIIATGPQLQVDPTSFDFEMNFGGLLPESESMTIKNIGDGGPQGYQITVTTDDGHNWLQTSKSGGSTDDVVLVSINPSSLGSGSYLGNIHVDAGEIEGSPVNVPVTLVIHPTGMEVTPKTLFMQAAKGQDTPIGEILVNQSAPGSGAITWYAYVVPAGEWESVAESLRQTDTSVQETRDGCLFTTPDGADYLLQCVSWVNLTPRNGITPRIMQVTVDMDDAPLGDSRLTILVDGGPGTPNRFQGVDTRILISDGGVWLPFVLSP